ncbi:amino acid permease-domain-containing protein [Fusarium oxysporum]|nr:amino acid permease-domain-containing protein [Fusarium oxysporum]
MESSRANSGQSAPLLSQDLQPSTAVGFQQQGTVDWTRLLSGSVAFSVDVLSRLSRAGIEGFTICAARAIFSNVKIGPNGELRLHRALDKISAFPSFGKALWFGFGVKHIIWTLQESTEGLNCLSICACLTEGYPTIVAAKIIRELFLLYNPPAELTPALRQWFALVESSGGLLASSEFGLVLHGLTKLCLRDGQHNLRGHGSPKDIALVLKQVFEVSAGRLDRLFLSVAHWLLDLRVEVQDQDGTIIYRPDGTRSESSLDSQVIITYQQGHSRELLRVSRKHSVIPTGKMLFNYTQDEDIMSCGRVSWNSCLVDTFGSPMRLLLGSQAHNTGACLGSAARIFLASVRDGEGHLELSHTHGSGRASSPISESSYGRGFYLLARRLLPELGHNPVLHQTMEAAVNKGYLDAAQQFSQSFTSLRQLCSCVECELHARPEDTVFCLPALILTICTLIRAMSTICMQQDLEVRPTRSAIDPPGLSDYDPVVRDLLGTWHEGTFALAQMLFAGRQRDRDSDRVVAASHSGLCFCLNTLTEITSDSQRACVVTVVPGKIEWNNFMYDMVRDQALEKWSDPKGAGYDAVSMTTVTEYDDLTDSSTPGLTAELIIQELFPESTSLSVIYRVSAAAFPGRQFTLGAYEIWQKLNNAFTAASCEGKTCDSLNGFQSILVQGEGLLPKSGWQMKRLPITPVLSAKDVSVWIIPTALVSSRLVFGKMGFSNFFESQKTTATVSADPEASDSEPSVIHDGGLAYTRVKGGNGSKPSYQEAVGAPVESHSPLGYNVGWLTVIFLNVNMMIGTGIFSTPSSILNRAGSVGLALIIWFIGFIMAASGFSVYLELASYFPNRSGSEVVYLEQAYPRPKHFFPVTFAVQSVILSFSSSNAVVLSKYLWRMTGDTPSEWQMRGVAIAAYTLAVIFVIAHNKYSLWLVNFIGALKILTLVFISIAGFVVLGGNVKRIPDPGHNFRDAFAGATPNGNDLASALVSIVFSYAGYWNAFNVVNEIQNPIPTLKRNGAVSLTVVAVLYMLCNIAYFAVVPKEEFAEASEIAASVFFSKLFGDSKSAANVLNFLVLLSAFGNLLAVLIGSARMLREIGRQGVLPYTNFWVSTKPFGTPLGPYILKWVLTFIMIVAPSAGDAFTFVVSLGTYPDAMFRFAMVVGLYVIRRRRSKAGIGRSDFKAWHPPVIFYILIQVFILVMPWYPPKGGPYAGDVSFWYATYCVVGIAIVLVCALYYVVWMFLLPKWKGYAIRTEITNVDDNGANTHRLVRVPYADLPRWDEEHDEAGNLRQRSTVVAPSSEGSIKA